MIDVGSHRTRLDKEKFLSAVQLIYTWTLEVEDELNFIYLFKFDVIRCAPITFYIDFREIINTMSDFITVRVNNIVESKCINNKQCF